MERASREPQVAADELLGPAAPSRVLPRRDLPFGVARGQGVWWNLGASSGREHAGGIPSAGVSATMQPPPHRTLSVGKRSPSARCPQASQQAGRERPTPQTPEDVTLHLQLVRAMRLLQ